MTVGERIKAKRKELQLTQLELAKRGGFSGKSDISKMENAGNEIGMNRIEKIAKALNVTPAYLLGWEVEVEPVTKESQTDRAKHLAELYMYILEAYAAADDGIKSAVDKLLDVKKEDNNGENNKN